MKSGLYVTNSNSWVVYVPTFPEKLAILEV